MGCYSLHNVLPLNIHTCTYLTEGQWNSKGVEEKYEAKTGIFSMVGWGVQTKETLCRGGMDILEQHVQ